MTLTKRQNRIIMQAHIDYSREKAEEARAIGETREWEKNLAFAQYLEFCLKEQG